MLTIRDKLRASSVNRWHTLGNINRTQNVAEHSFNIALLAEELLTRLYKSIDAYPSTDELYQVMRYAILHDLSEVLLGDQPSPSKTFLSNHIDNFSAILHKMERICVPELVELDETFKRHPLLGIVCKACDCIEAYHFITINGNSSGDIEHVQIVQNKLLVVIENVKQKGMVVNESLDWTQVDSLIHDMLKGDSALLEFERNGDLLNAVGCEKENGAKATQ
jgi:hypothetical protein